MKRKVAMMGLAMVTGVPHAVGAKGLGKEYPTQSYSSWNAPYMPHYGAEGVLHPLLDHVSAPSALERRGEGNVWRLQLAPPAAVSAADDPLAAGDKRVGVSLRMNF